MHFSECAVNGGDCTMKLSEVKEQRDNINRYQELTFPRDQLIQKGKNSTPLCGLCLLCR